MTNSRFLSYRHNQLWIEDVSAAELIRQFNTPLYVYSKAMILARYASLSAAFSLRPTLICYALKANSNAAFSRLLASQGSGADVVSGGELRQALKAGFDPQKILFSGVGKTREEMELAMTSGILSFNAESFEEMKILESVARSLKKTAPVSVRVNFPVSVLTHPHTVTSGPASKFGVDKKEALQMYEWARKRPRLKIVGLHCHIGSQILSPKPYAEAARLAADFIKELSRRQIPLSFIDLGGGFGVGPKALDISKIARAFERELSATPLLRLIIEPGRFLVAESGVLLTRVLYLKRASSRHLIIVDAGMNDFLRPALYGAHHPILPVIKKRTPAGLFDVAGPVCESADFFDRGLRLSRPSPGEALAILNAGAYGFSMSSQYNFRPRAAEVLASESSFRLIRSRETFSDLTRREIH